MIRPAGVQVHPLGLCESEDVGEGTRIWAFAHVLPGAVVGRDCNVCDHAFVETGAVVGDRVTVKNAVLLWDGVTVEDDVFLGPNVVFTNDLRPRAHVKKTREQLVPTRVRRGATLGAGVTVVCGTTIGEHAFVAAGAVVTQDVAAHAFVVGNPGRQIGWVCSCGERASESLVCAACASGPSVARRQELRPVEVVAGAGSVPSRGGLTEADGAPAEVLGGAPSPAGDRRQEKTTSTQ